MLAELTQPKLLEGHYAIPELAAIGTRQATPHWFQREDAMKQS